ncbi:M23 family metallopeptidase [Brevundimonas diminuta]|uniref:M23 family metallopeptidase n=1 Tax=Brevundimonas diminuta TaxID=293 RepID=UPI001F599C6C|nr:M23 family metallopeptidase [Brevundimonas diminuta]
MADDLSRSNQRRNAQDRVTENRDAIAPTRRETRVADAQVRSDMRSAYRGDGGADQINRFFKQLEQTNQAYWEADIAQTRKTAEVEYADGMTDATAGREMDPLHQQAVAYQRAYHSTVAAKRQTEFETETTQEMDRMINSGSTVEEIEAFMQASTREFIAETADTYELPDVKRQVGERLMRWSQETNTRASAVLKEKTDKELIDNTVSNAVASLARGDALNLSAERTRLTEAGLNGEAVQEALVNGIVAYSQETGDTSVLQNLLDERDPTDPEVVAFKNTIEGQPLPPVAAPAAPSEAPAPTATRQSYAAPVANMDRVTSGMGARRAPLPGASTNHGGVDIAMPVGTAVSAPADGVVEVAGVRGRGGKELIIRHADGSKTGFAHLDRIGVKVGDTVRQGQNVAASGNTGNSTGPHLHWTYRDAKGERHDPRTIVGSETKAMAADETPEGEVKPAAEIEPARRERVPGRSILTPAQQVRILNAIDSIEGDSERKTEQARQAAMDELTMDLWRRASRGEDVSDTIEQAVRRGVLTPSEGMTTSNAFRSLRDSTLEGEANDDVILSYGEKFAANNPSYSSITAQLDRDYRAGRLGTGRAATRAYIDLRTRAASGARGDASRDPAQNQIVGNARSYVSGALRAQVTQASGGTAVQPHMLRLVTQAENEFERRLANGEDPMQAADAIVRNYSNFLRGGGGPNSAPAPAGTGNSRAPGATQTNGQQAAQLQYIPGQGLVPVR